MSIAMATRFHINLYIYIYKTTSVPILVFLLQNAQSDEKVILSHCTKTHTKAEAHSCVNSFVRFY